MTEITYADIKITKEVVVLPKQPIAEIQAEVCAEHRISLKDMLGPCRRSWLVKARQTAMWIARSQGHKYPALATAFRRDHTTVLHAVRKIDEAVAAEFAEKLRMAMPELMP